MKKKKETFRPFVERDEKRQGESTAFFVTEDGRKINYLENPVEMPKKSGKTYGFDIDEIIRENSSFIISEMNEEDENSKKNDNDFSFSSNNSLDFDIDIKPGDDFDI